VKPSASATLCEVIQHDAIALSAIESPVGRLLAGATRNAVRVLEFTEPETFDARLAAARRRFPDTLPAAESPLLEQLRRELDEYFAARRSRFEVPLAFSGTAFQQKVWSGLLAIGYGETASYLELARAVGDEKSVRAVGQANGQNPIAIVIPCHRVISANGDLGGYGGGPWRKQYLLDLERGDRLF
jgi:AraC family transcriptional regulator, regulatory protein of adaptative response / methylated-DNA-[protein]-cysteine methyltransferase